MSVGCSGNLFGNRSQFIKTNGGDFIAVEASNTRERLILSDLRIPYKQILKSRVILKTGQTNYLLNQYLKVELYLKPVKQIIYLIT